MPDSGNIEGQKPQRFQRAKSELLTLMKTIYDDLNRDLSETVEFGNERLNSFLIYLRINEIFQSTMILLEHELAVCGAMQMRPLSEAYILLKASIKDPDFQARFMKKSSTSKVDYIRKILKHYDQSAITRDKASLEAIKLAELSTQPGFQKNLQDLYSLFEKHDELDMYLHVYVPGCDSLHLDVRSLKLYLTNGRIVPQDQRDYTSIYIHTCYGAIYVMLRSYLLYCDMIGKTDNVAENLFQKVIDHSNTVGLAL